MVTHLKPEVLEYKVKWSLGSIITDKPSREDGILAELFKLLKDDAVKSPAPYCNQDGEALHTQQKQDRADCGSDHQLLIAKFRLKLKKVGKTTRPFRDDLNQIPYDYTVEVTNRFKGLDLIDRLPEELWTEVCDIV